MRKLPLLFFCVIFMLASCSSEPAPIAENFSANFSAVCNDVSIKGSIITNDHNITTLKIVSPSSMKGYAYSFKNNNLTVTYNNMKLKAQDNYLPNTAFPAVVYNVLKSLNKENNCYCHSVHDSFAEYKGKSDSGKFTLTAESSTGAIRSIEISSIDFAAEFSDVKIIN